MQAPHSPQTLARPTAASRPTNAHPSRHYRWVIACAVLICSTITCAQTAPASTSAHVPSTEATPNQPRRPRIGLVLSGGGARGLSHVGVLKVLERERIPIDVIAGTSMGAIIGGLYASGMSASELESELLKVDWDAVFASRVSREHLSQRRKEEDFEISPVLEIGMRDGELRMPLSALSGRGLEALLRRYTLPVRNVKNFDALSIPFRALATNMEDGQAVILSEGDLALALALRSSMSVPGVFAPTDVGGRILGDGGLVNNVPIDVARAMGAEVLIVVNIGTPLAKRHALGSVGGLAGQMVNILTEQNVQRSLSTLGARDVLVSPQLGELTSGDFDKTQALIQLGEQGALQRTQSLSALALSPAAYAHWRAARKPPPAPSSTVQAIVFRGTEITNPARFASELESRAGQPFDAAAAERDARRLAASGDYLRADPQLISTAQGDTLVFDLEDKPWGPNYFRLGLDMGTDFRGESSINIKISHNRHWLTPNGSEWRNQVQIGQVPRWFTELYHPLNWTGGLSNDWFAAAYGEVERRRVAVYNSLNGLEQGRFEHTQGRVGLDLGQRWGELGAVRLGLTHLTLRSEPELFSADYQGPTNSHTTHETGLRLGVVIDQLDYANFPQHGYRLKADVVNGRRRDTPNAPITQPYNTIEAQGSWVRSWEPHTLNVHARIAQADQISVAGQGRYTLGGFHQMSGFLPGQMEGNSLLFGRLIYYRRLGTTHLLARALFVGGSLEAGNTWPTPSLTSLSDLRTGGSLFVGADTSLGPLYFGLTHAAQGSTGVYLFIGRP